MTEKSELQENFVRNVGCGVVDIACKISVAGSTWYEDYKNKLIDQGLSIFMEENPRRRSTDLAMGGSLVAS